MLDCLFIGSATKDTLLLVDAPPASDQRIAASQIVHACGGIASVSASAFQKLGGAAGLITAVGKASDVTDFILRDIEGRGMPYVHFVHMEDADSPFSAIQVEADGRRCITCFGGCSRRMTLDMLPKEALRDAKMIHMGGLEDGNLTEMAKWCRENTSALISVDSGNLTRRGTDAVLPYCDIFIPDDKTVKKTLGVSPEEACRYYAEKGVSISCVTLGDKGSLAYADGKFTFAPPSSANVVDTTGAGDNFHGAFLWCVLQRWDMEKTLRFCNAFSALTCEGMGGLAAQPTAEQVFAKING